MILGLAVLSLGIGYRAWSDKQELLKVRQNTNKVFLDFVSQKKKLLPKDEEVSLVAVGDMMLSRAVAGKMKKNNNAYPFLKTVSFLRSADITFGNLENPITEGPTIVPYEMMLRADPGVENVLADAGFDVLSLANNHTPNFGVPGLMDTFSNLSRAGIAYIGAGQNAEEANRPVYLSRNGLTFAFLAYNDSDVVPPYYEAGEARAGTTLMRSDKMAETVKQAKQKADFVIVSMHAGDEYASAPNSSQVDFAHKAIEAGAELVIGHHPHVVQTLEKYKGKYIFYSLGNFIFDQTEEEMKQGLALKVFFTKTGVSKIYLYPIVIRDLSQPEFLSGVPAANVVARLQFPLSNTPALEWNKRSAQFDSVVQKVIKSGLAGGENISRSEETDIDKNGKVEKFVLRDGRLEISRENKVIWESSRHWWVDDFALADANNDGMTDISLSVWKAGDFGASKPFWVKENDMSIKNHFFIFDLKNETMRPLWQSSNLEAPNCEFKVVDIDGDSHDDLVTLEGQYSQMPGCDGNYVALWKWNGWGFSNVWRSRQGEYGYLGVELLNDRMKILVNGITM